MILRFTQKLGCRLKIGKLKPMPMDKAPVTDWTAHVFYSDRVPFILVSNTATLYSTVLFAKGLTGLSVFLTTLLPRLRGFMQAEGLASTYDRLIQPQTGAIGLATTLNRSVTGSMNELVATAKVMLAREELSPHDLAGFLNDTLLSAIRPDDSRGYGKPRDAFRALVAKAKTP